MATMTVAEFISDRISASGKKQIEVARDVGFRYPNVLSMIKNGQTKVPMERIGAFARVLNVEPMLLLMMCFEEYYPETWRAIAPILETSGSAGASEC